MMNETANVSAGATAAQRPRVRWRWILIGLFIAGVVLTLWHPIWILQPTIGNMWILYAPVYYLWLIAVIVRTVARRSRFNIKSVIAVSAVAIVQVLAGYVILVLFYFSVGTIPKCTQGASGVTVSYTCQSSSLFAPIDCAPSMTNYEFVGIQGIPFVLKTKEEFIMGKCYNG